MWKKRNESFGQRLKSGPLQRRLSDSELWRLNVALTSQARQEFPDE